MGDSMCVYVYVLTQFVSAPVNIAVGSISVLGDGPSGEDRWIGPEFYWWTQLLNANGCNESDVTNTG